MPSTGFTLGSTVSTYQYGSSAGSWSTPENVLADDSNSVSSQFQLPPRIRIQDFPWDFAGVPVGIEAQIRARVENSVSAVILDVAIVNNGVRVLGSGTTEQSLTASNQLLTWGGPTNMWNFGAGGLSNADAHSAGFGLDIAVRDNNSAPRVFIVEAAWVNLHYEAEDIDGTADFTLPGIGMSAQGELPNGGTAGFILPPLGMLTAGDDDRCKCCS